MKRNSSLFRDTLCLQLNHHLNLFLLQSNDYPQSLQLSQRLYSGLPQIIWTLWNHVLLFCTALFQQTCSDLADFVPVLILRGANWSLWTHTYISAEIRGKVTTMQSLWEPCEMNLVQAESYSLSWCSSINERKTFIRPAHSISVTLFKRQTKKKKSITAANTKQDWWSWLCFSSLMLLLKNVVRSQTIIQTAEASICCGLN